MKLNFKKWMEMAGTGVVSPKKPGKNADYQVWGDQNALRKQKKAKK